jgi:hypothetical protein
MSRTLTLFAAGLAVLGLAVPAGGAESASVVHVYDVQVKGVYRVTLALPSNPRPLDFGYSEASSWTETYRGVRLEVVTSELTPDRIELKLSGNGTIAGKIDYRVSAPGGKNCAWSSSRSEPGELFLGGFPYAASGPGSVTYRLNVRTGRRLSSVPKVPTTCTYYEAAWAKFDNAPLGTGGAVASGSILGRSTTLVVELRKPQQPGQLAFPLNRLHAGAGFVLNVKGKTTDTSGRRTSEGTVRITFVPRAG